MDLAIDIFTANTPVKPAQITDNEIYKELTINIVTQLELKYWIDGEYPEQHELEEKFGLTGNSLQLITPKINEILETRGLPPVEYYSTLISNAKKSVPDLDPYFVAACGLICDTFDKRARAVKLKAVGLTTKKFTAFLQKPAYFNYYQLRVAKAFAGTNESAKLSLSRNVEAGDLQSIKYYWEVTGQHDPNKEIKVNVQKLILLFMEILARHVPTNVIDAVSRDFDTAILEIER